MYLPMHVRCHASACACRPPTLSGPMRLHIVRSCPIIARYLRQRPCHYTYACLRPHLTYPLPLIWHAFSPATCQLAPKYRKLVLFADCCLALPPQQFTLYKHPCEPKPVYYQRHIPLDPTQSSLSPFSPLLPPGMTGLQRPRPLRQHSGIIYSTRKGWVSRIFWQFHH